MGGCRRRLSKKGRHTERVRHTQATTPPHSTHTTTPRPPHCLSAVASAALSPLAGAVCSPTCSHARTHPVPWLLPAALEIMDNSTIRAVEASVFAAGYPVDAGAALSWSVLGRPNDTLYAIQLSAVVLALNGLLFAPLGVLHVLVLRFGLVVRRGLVGIGLVALLVLGHAFFMSEPAVLSFLLRHLAA